MDRFAVHFDLIYNAAASLPEYMSKLHELKATIFQLFNFANHAKYSIFHVPILIDFSSYAK